MSYGKIDPKLEATQLSREEILARLDRLEADIDVMIAHLVKTMERDRQQKATTTWWITPLT